LETSDFDLRFPQILPVSFVEQHGDKFRQSALLRLGLSTKVSWPVTLTIQVHSPKHTSVSFSGGWRAFATANGLVEGDSLVFALTAAMSEFEVYLFRENGSTENPRRDLGSLQVDTRRYNSPLPGFFKKLTTTNVSDGVGCLVRGLSHDAPQKSIMYIWSYALKWLVQNAKIGTSNFPLKLSFQDIHVPSDLKLRIVGFS
jgi:hypothetical protein